MAAVCGFALSCWNTQGLPWNRRHLEGSICCSKTFYIPFSIHSAFQNMQAAQTVCTYAPPYHQRCWLLNWTLITRWTVSLFFSPEDTASVISNKNQSNLDSSDHIALFHKQSILNEPWPTGHDGASGPCSHMASFLHDRASVGICRWHAGLCLLWFLKVFLGPFSNVNDRTIPMSDAVSSTKVFSLVPYAQRFLQFLWIFWWCYAL